MMPRRHGPGRWIPLLILLTGLSWQIAREPDELTAQEQRGKEIYLTGKSPSGQAITALLGQQSTAVPASVLPCASCHGRDGRGKPEGGVTPANLTWEALTKPYGATRLGARQRPPYTEQRLKRAITMGLDAGGTPLDGAMPRYQLAHQDLEDLVAYLKKVGKDHDEGLSEASIRVGVILAPRAQLAPMNAAVKAVLTAYFDEVNQRGGLYNRRVDLLFSEAPEALDERADAARTFIEGEALFALVAPFIAGADEALAALAAETALPFIGAFSLHPQVAFPLNRHVFYLYAGLPDQGRALATFAARRHTAQGTTAAVIYAAQAERADAAQAIEAQGRQAGWAAVTLHPVAPPPFDAAALVDTLRRQDSNLVFWLGPAQQEHAFLKAAAAAGWAPTVFMPGALAGPNLFEAPRAFAGRLFLSFPTLPSDQTPDGTREYEALADAHTLPPQQHAAQMAALAAAKVFAEALKRAGKDVSREKLIEALEGFYQFHTGFTPLLSYGPNQRVGAPGAYVVTVDLEGRQLVPAGDWIDPQVLR